MRVRRRALWFAVLPVATLLLAGCTSSPVGVIAAPPQPASATVEPTHPAPTPTTPPPTQDVSTATPLHLKCKALVPTAVVTGLTAGLKRDRGWVPAAGTQAAHLAALRGTVCRWRDATTGSVLEVAVAKPSASDATALKNDLVERSNSVPTYGQEAYFQVVDHIGEVDAFRGRTWIVARSNEFFEPGDATAVMQAVNALFGGGATPAPTASATPGVTAVPTPTPTPTAG